MSDTLGYVVTSTHDPNSNDAYKILRYNPKRHPAFPYMYASQMSNLSGSGMASSTLQDAISSAPIYTSAPITSQTRIYNNNKFKVTFSTKPYNVLEQSVVPIGNGSYYPPISNGQPYTNQVEYTYAMEWCRNTSYTLTPQNNSISSPSGSMIFPALGSAGPPATFPILNAPPKSYLPDAVLTMTVFGVPYAYITDNNSFISYGGGIVGSELNSGIYMNQTFLGCINQNDWFNWPAGSLLFVNYSTKIYNQPYASITNIGTLNAGGEWDEYAKLCDVTLTFLYTNRNIGTPVTPPYGNWIAKGWNLQPYFAPTNDFYFRTWEYVCANYPTMPNKQYPAWPSAPFELLLTDPRW